jgi:regulator of sigma E protease
MSILIGILITVVVLGVLVLVHEFGHFITAKWFGMRVHEFGIGLPPRIKTLWEKGGTKYTLNALPIGGFVKIEGEDGGGDAPVEGSFATKSWWQKIIVLSAGIIGNFILAILLLSVGYMTIGLPASATYNDGVENAKLFVLEVNPDSAAAESGLKPGDNIISVHDAERAIENPAPKAFQEFIQEGIRPITLSLPSGEVTLTPHEGEQGPVIGIAMDAVGTLQLPFLKALKAGAITTRNIIVDTYVTLKFLIVGSFRGSENILENIAGPVGLVGIIQEVSSFGFSYLLSLAAHISVYLAIFNLIPFPALDGGRILFVLIETIKRSPINPKVNVAVNSIGFALLLLLMVVVTYNDVVRLL